VGEKKREKYQCWRRSVYVMAAETGSWTVTSLMIGITDRQSSRLIDNMTFLVTG